MHISNGILIYSVFSILLICKVTTLNCCQSWFDALWWTREFMQNFPPGSQPMFKELCRFSTEGRMHSTYDMYETIHHILVRIMYYPQEGVLPKFLKLSNSELLGCEILFSSRSSQCFLPNVLLFSLAALLVHQNSPVSFPDHPYHCGSINKCTNRCPQMSPRLLSVCIEIKWWINRKCSTHFISKL